MSPRTLALALATVLACDAEDGNDHHHVDATTDVDATTTGTTTGTTAEPETGRFATVIRPIFDARCVGCHGPVGAQLGLVLGPAGTITSAEILGGLVSVAATAAPMNLVEPGDPAASWLYRKITADFTDVTCAGTCGGAMPPAGAPLTVDELRAIESWIADGAPSGDPP